MNAKSKTKPKKATAKVVKKAKAKKKPKVKVKAKGKSKPQKKEEVSPGGRPEHEPTKTTRTLVKGHISCGTPQDKIALILNIDPKTLRKHYREEIDTAEAKINFKVASLTLKECEKGNFQAQRFWLKCRAGWKETDGLEVTGKNGGPIETSDTRQRLLDRLNAKLKSGGNRGASSGAV